MGTGRLESLASSVGIIIIVAMILLGVMRMMRDRGKRRSSFDDPDGLLDDLGEDTGEDAGPPQFRDFAEALQQYVTPLAEAHPDWDRLDGAMGIPGRGLFRFERNGVRFEVNGETRFKPLMAAREWIAKHPGEDPLEVQSTGRIGKLKLRQEIWPNAKDVLIENR